MAPSEDDFCERLAAAYVADRDGFHRVAEFTLRSNGFRGPDVAHQDVVQNAIVSLLERPVSGVENYAALLMTTIKRRAIDMVRSESKSADRTSAAGQRHLAGTTSAFEDVDDAVDAARMFERLEGALAALSSDERRVILAVDQRKETQVAVAGAMEVTKQRVGQILAQARSKLKTMMEEAEA